jgi:hypothetical protein
MTALNGYPSQTTSGSGLFNGASSTGLIQGYAQPDPATRWALRSGIVSQSETVPMWGGIGVYADVSPISTSGPRGSLGQVIGRATALTGSTALIGFSVFDQAYNMVNDPNNPVPTAGSGQSIGYYPLGSRARVAVACDPSLISLRGGEINQQVSWDFVNQILVPYLGTLTISSGTYVTGTGVISLTMSAGVTFSAGDSVILSSLTGTGAYASLDGTWTVMSASGTAVTVQGPVGAGAATITGGSLTLGSGASSALPVVVLSVYPTGCRTVQTTGGLYTWNENGSAAIIQLTGGTTA